MFAATSITALSCSTVSLAETRRFAVPAQPAASAIRQFARQAGVPILSPAGLVTSRRVNAVHGSMEVDQALEMMLRGTRITSSRAPGGTIVLKQAGGFQQIAQNFSQESGSRPVSDSRSSNQTAAREAVELPPEPLSADIVVTGSRTVANGNSSPTPITVQTIGQLQTTTPTTVADALNKLPAFGAGGSAQQSPSASGNANGNYLNLRGFGVTRNLILLDGQRVTPTTVNGSVDVNSLPELLVQRVDVVTGGVSAVYGTDAVSGVVNYVLDHRFNGVKAVVNRGISSRGDNASWKAGLAVGTGLLDDRVHIEGSYQHFASDGLPRKDARAFGAARWCRVGNGSAAAPYRMQDNCAWSGGALAPLINTGPGQGLVFREGGVLTPFVHGALTASPGTEVGGDGTAVTQSQLLASTEVDQAFARADIAFGGDINGYVQGSYTRSKNKGAFGPFAITFFNFPTSNPYLTPAAREQLSQGGATSFLVTAPFTQQGLLTPRSVSQTTSITAGFNGKLFGDFKWNAFYTHGVSDVEITTLNNIDQTKLAASLDAAVSPSGQIECRVTITNPGLYPGCRPLNIFTPGALTAADYDYVTVDTSQTIKNTMDNAGGTIAGSPFELPAGPLVVAFTGEYRKMKLKLDSPFPTVTAIDCTGLARNCPAPTFSALYYLNATSKASASQTIWEGAAEATVPVLRNSFLGKSLEINGAVRYADYSVSGKVTTWKLGANWEPFDDLRIRVTRSQDIRAPSLYDLFQPATFSSTGFAEDLHTGQSGVLPLVSTGNPSLVPEKAKTWTAGLVYRPGWAPRFSLAVDFYSISINNAILNVGPTPTSNRLCEESGGTSSYCSLFERPLPFEDRSPANYPTRLFSRPLNAALQKVQGVDVEANYRLDLGEMANTTGVIDLRMLMSYQPRFYFKTDPTTPRYQQSGYANSAFEGPGPTSKLKFTLAADYSSGPFRLSVLERLNSGLGRDFNPNVVWAQGRLPWISYTDVSASVDIGSKKFMTMFFNVQNLFDQQPRIYSLYNSFLINFRSPIAAGDDVVGRYFTAGVRVRL